MKKLLMLMLLPAASLLHAGVECDLKPLVKTEVEPAEIVTVGGTHFIDFGKAAFGRVRFQASTEDDKHVVVVHIGEVLDARAGKRINRRPGGHRRYCTMR